MKMIASATPLGCLPKMKNSRALVLVHTHAHAHAHAHNFENSNWVSRSTVSYRFTEEQLLRSRQLLGFDSENKDIVLQLHQVHSAKYIMVHQSSNQFVHSAL